MINLLLVFPKFIDKNIGIETNNFYNQFSTSNSTELFTNYYLYNDEIENINKSLLDYLSNNATDIILFIYHAGYASLNPTIDTIKNIKQLYPKIKLVFVWCDAPFHTYIQQSILETNIYADKHITLDGSKIEEYTNNWISLAQPQPDNLYYPDNQIINISFMGKFYSDRIQYINYLFHHSVPVNITQSRLSENEYARNIRQSKINLNFSLAFSQVGHQCKGRVFEILASKSLLLESNNSITSLFLTPYVDYIPFDNPSNLMEKIIYYIKTNEAARLEIAENGYQTYQRLYHSRHFWNYIANLTKE